MRWPLEKRVFLSLSEDRAIIVTIWLVIYLSLECFKELITFLIKKVRDSIVGAEREK
jgi:hypothetical protein